MLCGTVILKVGPGQAGALWPLTVASTHGYQWQNCALQLQSAHPYRETVASGELVFLIPSHGCLGWFKIVSQLHEVTLSTLHSGRPVGLLYLHIIAFHLDKRKSVYYCILEEKNHKSVFRLGLCISGYYEYVSNCYVPYTVEKVLLCR